VAVLHFSLLGIGVRVRCPHAPLRRLLARSYGAAHAGRGRAPLRYEVGGGSARAILRLTRAGARPRRAADAGHLLRAFDADLGMQLQRLRRDLFFLHAAVLVRHGRAVLLVGPSGAGKSTAAWALVRHGFRYAGDELAPVDVERMRVFPCPRALCLKDVPPAGYPLPADAARTSWGWHVPLSRLPGARRRAPVPLAAVFFVERTTGTGAPRGQRRRRPAEVAARLYAHALNPLAHPAHGLDPAVRLAEVVPAFVLDTRRLAASCRRVDAILNRSGVTRTAPSTGAARAAARGDGRAARRRRAADRPALRPLASRRARP
jgi:hypothetical protein